MTHGWTAGVPTAVTLDGSSVSDALLSGDEEGAVLWLTLPRVLTGSQPLRIRG
jgi:hypothetical protein